MELCRAVRAHHPDNDIAFMFDAEGNYDYYSALAAAVELEALGFHWFEAPLPDTDLEAYRELTRARASQFSPLAIGSSTCRLLRKPLRAKHGGNAHWRRHLRWHYARP